VDRSAARHRVATIDLHTGAESMYYGGDLIEIALAAVLASGWYAATGRALARGRRRARGSPAATAQPR
jgi:putative membrane protein